MEVYRDSLLYVEVEENEIPWLKIFSVQPYKEFTDCDQQTSAAILTALEVIEKAMREYYQPEKINIASFGNYLPRVHFHVMARFSNDSYFPECMWGKKQREGNLTLPAASPFYEKVKELLTSSLQK